MAQARLPMKKAKKGPGCHFDGDSNARAIAMHCGIGRPVAQILERFADFPLISARP